MNGYFSFKAGCTSTLDCAAEGPVCSAPVEDAPAMDYLAKDFRTFRDALLELSQSRYEGWVERSEADFGVMFLEALASMADDLSYFQDRVASEAYLGTATERRSIVRLARLVDYEPRPATAARVLLRIDVPLSSIPAVHNEATLAPPLPLRAQGPDGAIIDFELGTGIDDDSGYVVRDVWSSMAPYWWDDSERCLRAGAVEAWLSGDDLDLTSGQRLLIDTAPAAAGDPWTRQIVTLSEVGAPVTDPLTGDDATRVVWRAEDALDRDHDLTRTTFSANLVPATQGREVAETIGVGQAAEGGRRVLTRTGMNGAPQLMYTLSASPLAWLAGDGENGLSTPEIKMAGAHSWSWRRSLLDAGPFEEVFTVDPARYRPVGDRSPDGTSTMEYDGRDGDTVVFGSGVFGAVPDETEVFEVRYRVGGGAQGNLAAGTRFTFDPAGPLGALGALVDNPFPATGGGEAELDESVRRRAPHAFRRRLRRAARARDYEAFARELPWVQRANTTFRHTGTWLAAVTAPDPKSSSALPIAQRVELVEQLDRVRLAGRESLVRPPTYVPLDIVVHVCVEEDAFDEEVRRGVLDVLSARVLANGVQGFFHPDRFTFGQALSRRMIDAAVQRVEGVRGVLSISYRRRNRMSGWYDLGKAVTVEPWEVIRVDGNPSRPERGSVRVKAGGGK